LVLGSLSGHLLISLLSEKNNNVIMLKRRIRELEAYLGPLVNYTSDEWPEDYRLRWLMEYLFLLKEDLYSGGTFSERLWKKKKSWFERLKFWPR